MTALPAITRPNGKLYRPRKVDATVTWMDDEPHSVMVFGTHSAEVARPLAEEILRIGNEAIANDFGPDLGYTYEFEDRAELRWMATVPGRDQDGDRLVRYYRDNSEHGRACVLWLLRQVDATPVQPDGIMPPVLDGLEERP
ncbi:MAG: hypothetical protein ABJB03_00455 [Rhodoglobus sp.]